LHRCSGGATVRRKDAMRNKYYWPKVNVFKSEMADVDPDNCLNLVREYSEYPAAL
jgi:hypothetical protein